MSDSTLTPRDDRAVLKSGLAQLGFALRLAEKDGSDLVSVPLSVAELRAIREALSKDRGEAHATSPLPKTINTEKD